MTDTTTQAENQQTVANVLWLAELECPTCHGRKEYIACTYESGEQEWRPCPYCQGTGAKYPQLRLPVDTPWCQGWRPVSQGKAATEARKLPEFISIVLLHWPPDPSEPKRYRGMFRKEEEQYWDFADDADNATIAALMKMEEAKHAN